MLSALRDYLTLARAGYVLTRGGLLAFLPKDQMPPLARHGLTFARLFERKNENTAAGLRLSKALNRLGPSWIKLGQFLSTRPDVIGERLARDLAHLQDRLPPFPQKHAEAIVEEALERPLKSVFISFGPAVAAASIAQVHRAQMITDGVIEDVAVKVLRPQVRRRFAHDLRAFFRAARLIERFSSASRRLKPVGIVETLAASVAIEMDLRLEGAALSEMADNTKADEGFLLPGVKWDAVTQDVLTTEWMEGIPLSRLDEVKAAGHDLKNLARLVMQSFLRHALRDGFFHADMHQGNLMVAKNGELIAVDLGIMGRLSLRERRFLAEILWSFITRDYERGAEVHFEAGYVPETQSRALFAQALRAIGEPIAQKKASEISMARVLGQLVEYTARFGMETRLELVMLQKTMVVAEGVARSLDPDFDMWAISKPVVSEWMENHLGPKAQALRAIESGRSLGKILGNLPQHLRDFETVKASLLDMSENGVRLSLQSLNRLYALNGPAQRWQAAGLWAIALALLGFFLFR